MPEAAKAPAAVAGASAFRLFGFGGAFPPVHAPIRVFADFLKAGEFTYGEADFLSCRRLIPPALTAESHANCRGKTTGHLRRLAP